MLEHYLSKAKKYFSHPQNIQLEPLTAGGSSRNFYRLSSGVESIVLCVTTDLEELAYYVEFARFFREQKISVPRFFEYSLTEGYVFMEDVGDRSLFQDWNTSSEQSTYQKVLDHLMVFQSLPYSASLKLNDRPFDYHTFRWETAYFTEHFLSGVLKGKAGYVPEEEFHRLALLADSIPKVPMHRDLQSQNIYLKDDRIFFIDFQGSRMGNPFYDVASLLCDPYVQLRRSLREELFTYYLSLSKREKMAEKFYDIYQYVCLQRLMQALGAYGNLALNKGKKQFLQYIKPALSLLDESVEDSASFPGIYQVVKKAKEAILESFFYDVENYDSKGF